MAAAFLAGCAAKVPIQIDPEAKVHHIGERDIYGDYIDQFSVTYYPGWFKGVTVNCWLFELDRDGTEDSYVLYCKNHKLIDVLKAEGSLESIHGKVGGLKPEEILVEFLNMCHRNQLAVYSTY